jgi:histidinol dehydrogenase
MKIITTAREVRSFLRVLEKRRRGVDPEVLLRTEKILGAVKKQGDRALLRLTKRFDGHGRLRLTPSEIKRHARKAEGGAVEALRVSMRRIKRFHMRQRERSWSFSEGGVKLGQWVRPIRRVGVYVPGGKASYPSTVLMNVIPAQVAGVSEIAVAVPTPGGEVDPHVMAAIDMLGVREVYSVGGAQAVAAFAYGTESVGKVEKIVGPGNIYVATAKRMVFGEVDIDMIAGPSEILVIADSGAEPAYVAADLLSQAEHDELASAVLLTDSGEIAGAVLGELRVQLKALGRKDIARESLRRYGAILVVRDLKEAVALSNAIAPEHLEIMTRAPEKLASGVRNAGAVFLGKWTPEPLGDYAAGPNHTLPTCGTARFSSPLGVYDFIKRTSMLRFTKEGFMRLAPTVRALASVEGLEAHARAVDVRLKMNSERM